MKNKKILIGAISCVLSFSAFAQVNYSNDQYQAYFTKNQANNVASSIENSNKTQSSVQLQQKSSVQLTEETQDLLFLTNQDEVPMEWLSVTDNMQAGGLHGNIRTQIEIEDAHFKDSDRNSGKFKYALLNAFFRHTELPDWYFGFYFAKEDNYQGDFFDQSFDNNNNISEIFIGHTFETYRGKYGLEGMFGSESGQNRLKGRIKGWTDLRLSNNIRFSGFAMYGYQPSNNREDLNQWDDTSHRSFEIEPTLHYRFNNHNGAWFSVNYEYNDQHRKEATAFREIEKTATIGVWHNWSKLFGSVYTGVARDKQYIQAEKNIYSNHKWFVGLTASYPIVNGLRIYGETKYNKVSERNEEQNTKQHPWVFFNVVGLVYEF